MTLDAPLSRAFRASERRALGIATAVRMVVFPFLAFWLWLDVALDLWAYYSAFFAAFMALGAAHWWLDGGRWHAPWHPYAFALIDVALLTFAIAVPSPVIPFEVPAALGVKGPDVMLYLVFVAFAALGHSPGLVAWTGGAATLAWAGANLWVAMQPETVTKFTIDTGGLDSVEAFLAAVNAPEYLNFDNLVVQLLLLAAVSAVLTLGVWRSRQMVLAQAAAERARTNLHRYFPPSLVEELEGRDTPMQEPRVEQVAVLFADLVGYSTISERLAPRDVMALLREYHRRMEEAVFVNDGMLDKYVGDGIMASFGAPWPGPRDATNALACGRMMVDSIARWNAERPEWIPFELEVGVGIHHGTAVLGDVGGERSAAFAVIGDTTNVAARLQSMTRDLRVGLVASAQVVDAARREAQDADTLLARLTHRGPQPIRGREGTIDVWTDG